MPDDPPAGSPPSTPDPQEDTPTPVDPSQDNPAADQPPSDPPPPSNPSPPPPPPPASSSPAPNGPAPNDYLNRFLSSGKRPSDPFFPSEQEQGPLFLDDNACLCVLRSTPDNDKNFAWRCFGNHTLSAYVGNSGKWFAATDPQVGNQNVTALPLWDDSDKPKLDQVLVCQQGKDDSNSEVPDSSPLVSATDPNASKPNIFDSACTGKNQTLYSTAYYRTTDELNRNQTPVDGAPCYFQGAYPVQMVNLTSWQNDKDCAAGFYCPNNTINSLPQYCPPIPECADARLSGTQCVYPWNTTVNAPMGPFEPVVCSAGYYCPTGRELIRCPAGSFCPLGSTEPIKCAPKSHCPEGSQMEYMLLPLALLVVLEVVMIAATVVLIYRGRMVDHRRSRQTVLFSKSGLMSERKGYGRIEETEMEPMDPTPGALYSRPTGLESAMHAHMQNRNSTSGALDVESSAELRQFVDSMRKAIQGSSFGLTFDFQDLSFHPKGKANPVISEITGTIRAGSLAAIMGGSGAGKSTFFNALLGRQSHGGTVSVNGVPTKMGRLRRVMGYVPQDDIVLAELTVAENIAHAARIRLPRTFSAGMIDAHVDAVIDSLELGHVRDSLVGSVAKPVISGGQRKRVSIGMELAAAPMALFLDEPTSGLDATSAAGLMKTLKALSKLGISVIAIIHQPRTEIFEMIDDLLLLGNGRLVYQGAARDVPTYFAAQGFTIPPHANLGDVMTDIITGNGRLYKPTGDVSKEALIAHYAAAAKMRPPPASATPPRLGGEPASLRLTLKKRGAPWPTQLYWDLTRAMLQQWRLQSAFWFEMGVAALGGFLIGLAQNGKKGSLFAGLYHGEYAMLGAAADYRAAPEMSLLVCVCIGLVAAAPGVRVFADDMLVFRREAEAGHARAAYYAAKVLSTLPRMLLACVHFTVPLLLLAAPRIPWGAAFATNLLYTWCIYGLASVVSMVTRREDGPLLAVMASLIVAVLSGAAPPLSKVKTWHMAWLWYTSPGVWAAENYWAHNVRPLAYLYQVDLAATFTGFDLHREALDLTLLFVIGVVYRLVAFGGLLWNGRRSK